jgi:hypothetical protein
VWLPVFFSIEIHRGRKLISKLREIDQIVSWLMSFIILVAKARSLTMDIEAQQAISTLVLTHQNPTMGTQLNGGRARYVGLLTIV